MCKPCQAALYVHGRVYIQVRQSDACMGRRCVKQSLSQKIHNLGDGIFGFSVCLLDILHISPLSKYKVLNLKHPLARLLYETLWFSLTVLPDGELIDSVWERLIQKKTTTNQTLNHNK